MDPRNREQLKVLRNAKLSDSQKLGELALAKLLDVADEDPESLRGQFDNLLDKLDLLRQRTAGGAESPRAGSGYSLPLRKVKPGLELEFFVYQPVRPDYTASIYCNWFKAPADHKAPRLYYEYLTARMFDDSSSQFREDAPGVLELLKESMAVYEEAAPKTTRRRA